MVDEAWDNIDNNNDSKINIAPCNDGKLNKLSTDVKVYEYLHTYEQIVNPFFDTQCP